MSGNKTAVAFNEQNDVAWLKLVNPPANIMTSTFFDELSAIVQHNIRGEKFKGLVISSEGRHFSSGADIDGLLNLSKTYKKHGSLPPFLEKNKETFRVLYALKKPVVSIVKGICFGSGFELALAAKHIIAAPNCKLSFPEASFGLMPGLGGISRLLLRTGFALTAELVLSQKTLFADDALSMGIVDQIVEANMLENSAIKHITKLHQFTNNSY